MQLTAFPHLWIPRPRVELPGWRDIARFIKVQRSSDGKILRTSDGKVAGSCAAAIPCGPCSASATPRTLTTGISVDVCTPVDTCFSLSGGGGCQIKGTLGGIYTATQSTGCGWLAQTSMYVRRWATIDDFCVSGDFTDFPVYSSIGYSGGRWSANFTTLLGPACGIAVQTIFSPDTAGDCMSPATLTDTLHTGVCLVDCVNWACNLVIDITPNA